MGNGGRKKDKGCSIRVREIDDWIDALRTAKSLVEQFRPPQLSPQANRSADGPCSGAHHSAVAGSGICGASSVQLQIVRRLKSEGSAAGKNGDRPQVYAQRDSHCAHATLKTGRLGRMRRAIQPTSNAPTSGGSLKAAAGSRISMMIAVRIWPTKPCIAAFPTSRSDPLKIDRATGLTVWVSKSSNTIGATTPNASTPAVAMQPALTNPTAPADRRAGKRKRWKPMVRMSIVGNDQRSNTQKSDSPTNTPRITPRLNARTRIVNAREANRNRGHFIVRFPALDHGPTFVVLTDSLRRADEYLSAQRKQCGSLARP